MIMSEIIVNTDGAFRGKHGGVGSFGYVVQKNSKTVREDYGVILVDDVTNNYAEYMAMIKALRWLKESELSFDKMVVRSDSQLVVKQVNGEWSVNSDNLRELYQEVVELVSYFRRESDVEIEHVYREENTKADELSQTAIEDHLLAQKLKSDKDKKKKCPECGEDMVLRDGKYGKFWGCTGYPECDHTENYEDG